MTRIAMRNRPTDAWRWLRRILPQVVTLFLSLQLGYVALGFAGHLRAQAIVDAVNPNIILILADDLGYGTLGAYGGLHVETPNIDSLAQEGVRFTQAYTTAPICSPSRAAVVTGRYQQQFGFEFNVGPATRSILEPIGLDPTQATLGDRLGALGYATGIIGKWHLGLQDQYLPNIRGFDDFFGFLPGEMCYLPCPKRGDRVEFSIFDNTTPVEETAYLTDAFAREAVSFVERYANGPFFLYVPFNAIHDPLEATDEYLRRFPGVKPMWLQSYLAMTSALDDAVGKILDAVDRNGLADRTLIIFASDNGAIKAAAEAIQANGPLNRGKRFLFEGGIRIPLLMRWPDGDFAGLSFERPVTLLDIMPTIYGLLQITPDEGAFDGVDLGPYLSGEVSDDPHPALYWRLGPQTGAIRYRDWKLIRSVQGSRWLYNIATDSGETNNLAGQYPTLEQRLTQRLSAWSRQLPKPNWPPYHSEIVTVDGLPYQLSR